MSRGLGDVYKRQGSNFAHHRIKMAVVEFCLATVEACVLLHSFGCAFFIYGEEKMACFLIDFENECGNLLNGISHLNFSRNDEIIIFYSKNASHLTMELHKELEMTKAKKVYLKVETGSKNALDFQLSSYLGACIQKNPKKKYYILSKDNGYDCVCRFWRDNNIFVKRIEQFCNYDI